MKAAPRPRTDILVRAWNPSVRVAVSRNTHAARSAMQRHQLPIVDALPLGKLMASCSLMASILRGEERVIMDLQSAQTRYYAEAIAVGEVRGFARRMQSDGPQRLTPGASSSPLKTKAPAGTLSVKLVLYERAKPIESLVPVSNDGDVTVAIRSYFERSEQIGNLVELDAQPNAANDAIEFSGGLIVNALPALEGSSQRSAIDAVNARLQKMLPLHKVIGDEACNMQDFLELNAEQRNTNIAASCSVEFLCRCSSEALRDKLLTLQIEQMQKAGVPELRCWYCNTGYTLTNNDFTWLLNNQAQTSQPASAKKTKRAS